VSEENAGVFDELSERFDSGISRGKEREEWDQEGMWRKGMGGAE
jgi:hypothetical protein